MNFTDAVVVDAPPEAVWRCLADNELLRQIIPGCQAIRKKPEKGFVALIDLRLGFVTKKLEIHMLRRDIVPGKSVTIRANAGPQHSAVVRFALDPEGSGTRLSYDATATLGGLLGSGLGAVAAGAAIRKSIKEFGDRIGKVAASLPPETKQE